MSPPVRGRGLKHYGVLFNHSLPGRPHFATANLPRYRFPREGLSDKQRQEVLRLMGGS